MSVRMNKVILFLTIILFALLQVPEIEGNSSGMHNSGSSGCSCHAGASGAISPTHNFPAEYDSSTTSYSITVGFSGGNGGSGGGFSLQISAGTLSNPGSNMQISGSSATHSGSAGTSWTFQWSPPTSGSGDVTVNLAILNANGNGGNSGDVWSKTTFTILEQVPSISYSTSSIAMTKDTYSQHLPIVNGSGINNWAITPNLPTGLTFDTATGEISGTPTYLVSPTVYTVIAYYQGGDTTTTIEIRVNDIPPNSIIYNPSSFIGNRGSVMATGTPTASGGVVVSWEIAPSLPAGLNLDSTTGEISGTPTVISSYTTYTVFANNTGGSANTTIDITVYDIPPYSIAYNLQDYILSKDSLFTSGIPTNLGGAVVSWSISPSLPAGLSLDSTTGEFSGTPTVISPQTTYTVTATNSGGTATTTVTITVTDAAPYGISYSDNPFVLTKDTQMPPNTPSVQGGAVVFWSISPTLTAGLSLDSTTGEFRGTPTVISPQTTYTVTALNSGGSATTTVTITVNDIIPSLLSYSPNTFVETKGSPMTAVTPTASGGPVVNWAISPGLPLGLTFDTSTGEIWGTPSAVSTQTTYTIYAEYWWYCYYEYQYNCQRYSTKYDSLQPAYTCVN